MPDRDDRGKDALDTISKRFDGSKTDEANEVPEPTQESQAKETSKTNETQDDDRTETTKSSKTPLSEKKQVLFYLSETQSSTLDLVEQTVALDVKRELDIELEKNRHIRPLVLHFGLDRLQELSAEEIRDLLEETEHVEDPP